VARGTGPPLSITTVAGTRELPWASAATIGRDPTNDIVIDDPLVSRYHARVHGDDGGWRLQDVGSTNGTFVGGVRVHDIAVEVSVVAHLGEPIEGPWVRCDPVPGAAALAGEPTDLGKATVVHELRRDVERIGRDDANDVVLDDLLVSRAHAELHRERSGTCTIVDLGSHNGTYVNGRRVERAPLGPADVVTIGAQRLRLRDGCLTVYNDAGQSTFAAFGLTVMSDANHTLLDDVGFALDASSFLGVVGPSGSGKSTLLGALTGYRPATRGAVYYGGLDVYREHEALRRRLGFVPQDDLVQLDLTVEQSLRYAARLRFPPDVGARERGARVDQVLVELGLAQRRDLRVRQLSGGQRKRVSVALELLTKPALLFLDEPTSGLDPGLERNVMQLLRVLADEGRIIVCVTHSVDSLLLCDRVLCLAPGGVAAYFGPPHLAAAHFGREDWHEVFQDLSDRPPTEWKTPEDATAKTPRALEQPLSADASLKRGAAILEPARRLRSWVRQFTTLTARYGRSMVSDRRAFAFLVFAGPILGLVLLLRLPTGELERLPSGQLHLFSRAVAPLLLVTLALTQLAINLSVREIVKELAIFKRERAVGISISAYLLSKVVVLAVIGIAQAAVIVLIATSRQGGPSDGVILGSARVELILVFGATAIAAMSMGLLASSLVTSENHLALVLPAIIGFQVLAVTGIALPSVPDVPVLDQTAYVSSASWGFSAAASTARLNELQALNNAMRQIPLREARTDPRAALDKSVTLFTPSNPASQKRLGDAAFNHDANAWTRAMLALLVITAASLIAAGIALRRYDPL
jgi:ABC transport system ATP-binding/permease protein